MKTLVLYESKTGNTRKYAEAIAERLHADVFPNKKVRAKKMKEYDIIIFGGWVRGGEIVGLNRFLSSWDSISDKDVIVFSSGMAIASSEGRKEIISRNLLDMYHLRYYQFRGSFDMKKLDWLNRFLLKRGLQASANSPDNPDGASILDVIDHPIDYYDTEKVNRVVEVVRGIEAAQAVKKAEIVDE